MNLIPNLNKLVNYKSVLYHGYSSCKRAHFTILSFLMEWRLKDMYSKILFYLLILPIFAACELQEDGLVSSVEQGVESTTKNVAIHLDKAENDNSGISLQLSIESLEVIVRKENQIYRLVVLESETINLDDQGLEAIGQFNSLEFAENLEVLGLQVLMAKNGHQAMDIDGNICEFQNLPASRRLVQIALAKAVVMEEAFDYELHLSLDIQNSIELKRNGKCKLNPKLSLPIFLRRAKTRLQDGIISLDRLMTDGLDENQSDEVEDGFLDLKEIKNLPVLRL